MTDSFVNKFILFDPPLVDFFDIWKALVLWNLVGFSVIFVVCGSIAAVVFRRHRFAIIIPVAIALIGSIVGFASGALLSFLVACLYAKTGEHKLIWYQGIAWGLILPISYTVHSVVKFLF